MNQTFSEKEILADALTSEKGATNNFNKFANECVHSELRNTVMDVLNKEHSIQQDVFNIMHEKDIILHQLQKKKKFLKQNRNFKVVHLI